MILPDPRAQSWGWRYLLFETAFLPSILVAAFGHRLSALRLNALFYLINALVVVLLMRRLFRESLQDLKKQPLRKLLIALGGIGVCLLISVSLKQLLLSVLPAFVNYNDAQILRQLQEEPFLTVLGVVLLAPLAEESLFRGVLFGMFRRRNVWAAYLISGVLFAVIHIQGYIGVAPGIYLLLSFAQYLPAGLCLAASYELSGNILVPILIHTAVNAVSLAAMR